MPATDWRSRLHATRQHLAVAVLRQRWDTRGFSRSLAGSVPRAVRKPEMLPSWPRRITRQHSCLSPWGRRGQHHGWWSQQSDGNSFPRHRRGVTRAPTPDKRRQNCPWSWVPLPGGLPGGGRPANHMPESRWAAPLGHFKLLTFALLTRRALRDPRLDQVFGMG